MSCTFGPPTSTWARGSWRSCPSHRLRQPRRALTPTIKVGQSERFPASHRRAADSSSTHEIPRRTKRLSSNAQMKTCRVCTEPCCGPTACISLPMPAFGPPLTICSGQSTLRTRRSSSSFAVRCALRVRLVPSHSLLDFLRVESKRLAPDGTLASSFRRFPILKTLHPIQSAAWDSANSRRRAQSHTSGSRVKSPHYPPKWQRTRQDVELTFVSQRDPESDRLWRLRRLGCLAGNGGGAVLPRLDDTFVSADCIVAQGSLEGGAEAVVVDFDASFSRIGEALAYPSSCRDQ